MVCLILLFFSKFCQWKQNSYLKTDQNSVIFKQMRKSCHQQNRKLLEAYELYQRCEYQQSLGIFQSILQKTSHEQLRCNLICTISVISATVGNYNYALQILEQNLQGMKELPTLIKIRAHSNLCFLQIIMGLYEQAIYTFNQIQQIIIGADNHQQAISFAFKLFFRVKSVQQLQKDIQISKQNSLLEAYYMLNMAFAKDVCGFQGSETLLKAAYPIFIMYKKMQLAVVCLRQLLLLPLCNKDILKYEKQMGKIMSMNLMEQYQLDNAQPIQCCKRIAQQFIVFAKQLNVHNQNKSQPSQSNTLWKLVLLYQNRKLISNGSLCQDEKQTIYKNIQIMLKQKNQMIVSEMKKTDFYINTQRQIQNVLHNFFKICFKKHSNQLRNGFKKIVTHSYSQSQNSRYSKSRGRTPAMQSRKLDKQNRMPVLLRDRSSKSINNQNRKSIKKQNQSQIDSEKDYPKIIYKMIKFCEYGSFLSKRNYNSDGGQYRFVRITQSVIKWAKNPQKIEESCQLYPLKDISSIHYGKCTPTLLKPSNQLLKQQLCFSLKLQKRTLDFYCKDFEQVCNWVCGFSYKLKQINSQFKGYSLGRMLWKRMFILLRQNFTTKIRKHNRNFYYETAQAIILFGKNNYTLPAK